MKDRFAKKPAAAKPATRRPPGRPSDAVEVFGEDDIEQGSPEWFAIRLGLCTASNFGTIMASGRDGGDSATRTKLLYRLAGEIISGQPAETFENDAMRRGRTMEAEALQHYAFTRGVEVVRVGFVRRTISNALGHDIVVGCSPDGLVEDDGVIQTKTMRPDLIVEMVDRGRFPTEHKAQCHGELWVTGRKWTDLKIFYSGMPISPTFRIERDEVYIGQIASEVEKFQYELNRIVERVRARGGSA